jgi:hypothetical protein
MQDALPKNMTEPEKESYLYRETRKTHDGQRGRLLAEEEDVFQADLFLKI